MFQRCRSSPPSEKDKDKSEASPRRNSGASFLYDSVHRVGSGHGLLPLGLQPNSPSKVGKAVSSEDEASSCDPIEGVKSTPPKLHRKDVVQVQISTPEDDLSHSAQQQTKRHALSPCTPEFAKLQRSPSWPQPNQLDGSVTTTSAKKKRDFSSVLHSNLRTPILRGSRRFSQASHGSISDTPPTPPASEPPDAVHYAIAESGLYVVKDFGFSKTSGFHSINERDEYTRFRSFRGDGSVCVYPENDIGACSCNELFLQKDMRGLDYSQYNAHALFHSCCVCNRRPACFLCLHCLKATCPSHVETHHKQQPQLCTLFVNVLDILTSYDRIFWCELCHRFVWKGTEVYEPLTDQIAATLGSYLTEPVKDVMLRQYVIERVLIPPTEPTFCPMGANLNSSNLPDPSTITLHPPWEPTFTAFAEGEKSEPKDPPKEPQDAAQPMMLLAEPQRRRRSSLMAIENAGPEAMSTGGLCAIVCSMQGWRSSQEDAACAFHLALPPAIPQSRGSRYPQDISAFCVFDGHGGDAVSKLASKFVEALLYDMLLQRRAKNELVENYYCELLKEALLKLDEHIRTTTDGQNGAYNYIGSTACIVLVSEDHIVCANTGDSGAVLVTWPSKQRDEQSFDMIPLSTQHRLSSEVEKSRVADAGYMIVNDRIEGMLAVPRALGDYDFKQNGAKALQDQAVTPMPDVAVVRRPRDPTVKVMRRSSLSQSPEDRARKRRDSPGGGGDGMEGWCVVIGCDGVLDTLPQGELCEIVFGELCNSTSAPKPTTDLHGVAMAKSCAANDSEARSPTEESVTIPVDKLHLGAVCAAGKILAKCVSPVLNDEGMGTDNASLILVHPF